jgi:sugar O-acyltransferase (sialic acid O-acetyltransferase NeuD family)
MINNLIIIGGGKLGRELYSWAIQTKEYKNEWIVKGFLDNRADILNDYNYAPPVLASSEDYIPELNDVFACAIGDPNIKKSLCDYIRNRDGKFINIIHPTVIMAENVKLGQGVVLCPYVVVSCDVVIGDFVTINMHSVLGHDVKIANHCQINVNVSINGNVELKEAVSVGSNAVILPDVVIENNAAIGAGSVVVRDVKPHQTVFGNPAKILSPDNSLNRK